MTTFSRGAVQIKQGNLTLYLTYVTPRDLFDVDDDFYTVNNLEPDSEQSGYQRILNETRMRRLSRHLIEAYPEGYAHLPTTVFLATDKSVDFDEETRTLEFDQNLVCPFSVVDGQHRIAGLKNAIGKDENLKDFQLPVTIATDLDDTDQMYHFLIVNTTQVPVDSSLRQQITRRFTDMQGVEKLPYTPHWIEREITLGRDAKALKVAEYLNDNPNSPIRGKIQMANDPVGRNKVKQSSFVNNLKREVFAASNPLSFQEPDIDKTKKIMLNYFQAIDKLFVNGRDRNKTGVYKGTGMFFFTGISKWVFGAIYASTNDFTTDSITGVIKSALDEIDDAYRNVTSPDWWQGSGGGGYMDRATSTRHINAFQQAINRSQASPKTKIRL